MTDFNEILSVIIQLAPSIGGVLGIVVTVLLSIKKVADLISEFKQSNELADLINELKQSHEDNKQLKRSNEKLISEITRIRRVGYTDDKN